LGWLPYGAASSFGGRALPGLLGTLGLALIGVVSLRRSYRTTMRLYSGQFSAVPASGSSGVSVPLPLTAKTNAPGSRSGKYPAAFLEKRFSGLSEYASAVTVASFRAIMRAPE